MYSLYIRYDYKKKIINWLLEGDPSVKWQVLRDLLDKNEGVYNKERNRICLEGWGKALLDRQDESGLWSDSLYSRKWISTTYTMLLLKRLGLQENNRQAFKACSLLLNKGYYNDGGINYFKSLKQSELCVTGMVLSILCYFDYKDKRLDDLLTYLIINQMQDGGWNCQDYRGAVHSSFHTTVNALDGLSEYKKRYPDKFKDNIEDSIKKAVEFLLIHRLFKSHRTGKIVDDKMTRLSFPPRWRYDILRILELFRELQIPYDSRMQDAADIILKKQTEDGKWPLQQKHPGLVFFDIEQTGKPSRMNTLRVLRVFKYYDIDY